MIRKRKRVNQYLPVAVGVDIPPAQTRRLVYEALRFAVYGAGQGMEPPFKDAQSPEHFLLHYSENTGDPSDWEGQLARNVADKVLEALQHEKAALDAIPTTRALEVVLSRVKMDNATKRVLMSHLISLRDTQARIAERDEA